MSVTHQAGWYADPIGRYHYRYYDGTGWTANVARDGVASRDATGLAPVGVSPASVSKLSPSSIWYWTAGAIGVVAVLLAIVIGVTALVDGLKKPVHYARATIPGGLVAHVSDPGTRVVYYEGGGKPSLGELSLTVTGPSGAPVPVSSYDSSLTYDASGHSGAAVASFPAETAGNYEVHAAASPEVGAQIAVGPNVIRQIVEDLVPALFVLGLGLLLAFVLAMATFVRRRASRDAAG